MKKANFGVFLLLTAFTFTSCAHNPKQRAISSTNANWEASVKSKSNTDATTHKLHFQAAIFAMENALNSQVLSDKGAVIAFYNPSNQCYVYQKYEADGSSRTLLSSKQPVKVDFNRRYIDGKDVIMGAQVGGLIGAVLLGTAAGVVATASCPATSGVGCFVIIPAAAMGATQGAVIGGIVGGLVPIASGAAQAAVDFGIASALSQKFKSKFDSPFSASKYDKTHFAVIERSIASLGHSDANDCE